jgi:hypothetical protein
METFTPEGVFDPVIWGGRTDDLNNLMNNAFNLLMEGKTLMSWTGYGNESTKQFVAHPMKVIVEVQYCLKQIDTGSYGVIIDSSKTRFV